MFPAWSRIHACYAPVAPAWFPTLWTITIEHVPIGPVQIGDRVPHSHSTAHIAVHIQVSKWRAWQADGTCMIDVPTLAEVSTQPCKAEKDPLPCMLHVQSTWYQERSAGRGMGTHMAHNPHRRAEVFGALLKIASGPWPVNVAFVLGCQASSPPSVPVYPGGMFPRWYHNHVAAIEKMFWAHNNLVYNLTIFRWTRCPTTGSGAGKHPDTAP